MTNLMYNSKNDTLITRSEMADLPLPQAMGRFHQPYSFSEYVEQVHEALDIEGLMAGTEEYAIQKDGQRMFGLMTIEPKPLEGELISASDWNLTMGIRGSHDQRIPRGITLGSQVIVCSNLCFGGNIGTFNTKQTTNIRYRIPSLIRNAVAQIPELAHNLEAQYDTYRNFEMKPRWGDAALVEIHRRGGLAAPQLARAIAEWDRPSHEEHAENGYSAWRLMNACTEALKPTGNQGNMNLVQDRSHKVTAFINEIAGI